MVLKNPFHNSEVILGVILFYCWSKWQQLPQNLMKCVFYLRFRENCRLCREFYYNLYYWFMVRSYAEQRIKWPSLNESSIFQMLWARDVLRTGTKIYTHRLGISNSEWRWMLLACIWMSYMNKFSQHFFPCARSEKFYYFLIFAAKLSTVYWFEKSFLFIQYGI